MGWGGGVGGVGGGGEERGCTGIRALKGLYHGYEIKPLPYRFLFRDVTKKILSFTVEFFVKAIQIGCE